MGMTESGVDKTVSKLKDELTLWRSKLDVLRAKIELAGQETKIDADRQLDEVKAKLMVVRSKLDEAKAAGAEKWGRFKSGVGSTWKELEGAFDRLVH